MSAVVKAAKLDRTIATLHHWQHWQHCILTQPQSTSFLSWWWSSLTCVKDASRRNYSILIYNTRILGALRVPTSSFSINFLADRFPWWGGGTPLSNTYNSTYQNTIWKKKNTKNGDKNTNTAASPPTRVSSIPDNLTLAGGCLSGQSVQFRNLLTFSWNLPLTHWHILRLWIQIH